MIELWTLISPLPSQQLYFRYVSRCGNYIAQKELLTVLVLGQ